MPTFIPKTSDDDNKYATDPSSLAYYATSQYIFERLHSAGHDNTPVSVLIDLTRDADPLVREVAFTHLTARSDETEPYAFNDCE